MTYARLFLLYGAIAGAVIIAGMMAGLALFGTTHGGNVYFGYLVMIIALTSILIGVKSHRDNQLGGVIRFWPAFLVGLGIALTASVAYVLTWEAYMFATRYTFMDHMVEVTLRERRPGMTAAAYQRLAAEMETMRVQYLNPLIRVPMTFAEIFPVGLIMALISAALLRNPRFLPARQRVG